MRKSMLFTLLICFSISAAVAQSITVQHEVKKGETLASVAKHYGVTPEMIKEANPQMGSFFYTGLKLNIPTKKETNAKKETIEEEISATEQLTSTPNIINKFIEQTDNQEEVEKDNKEEYVARTWTFPTEVGYGFVEEDAFGYKFTIGANYMITNNAYAGARIGYNSFYASKSEIDGSYQLHKYKTNIHMLSIPFEVGYALGTSKVALIPFLGFGLNLGLSGKSEYNDEKIKLKVGGKLGVSFDAGARLRLWGFNISGAYHIPLNEKQEAFFGEDGYFELSVGYGF